MPSFPIRRAIPADLPRLAEIERDAALIFANSPYPWIVEDSAHDPISADINFARDPAWVAVDSNNQPIALAIVHIHSDKEIHLHELDVDPRYARQGLGLQLIQTVAAWAKGQGAKALTLTTFDDVPWNGPYYTRLGFRTLAVNTLSPQLLAVRQQEAANGLPLDHRLCMQLDL